MPQLVEKIAAAWKTPAPRQRLTLIVSTTLALAALVALAIWAQQPTWGVLYAGLDSRDAQAVVQELQAQQVPVRIAGGGGSIEVPLARVDALRKMLADQGLPRSAKLDPPAMLAADSPELASSRQIELRAALERDVNGKVGRVLEPLVGPEGFVVKTTAEVDFTRVSRREKSFDPDSAVVMTEERTKERQSAATERQNQRASYEYSVSESSIEQPIGQLRRLSVAVLVDQRRGDGTAGPGSVPPAVPRSDEELSKIEQLVKGAIGFDEERGDRVTVEQVAFRQVPVEPAAGGFDRRSWIPLAKWAALVTLALFALALLARPWRNALRSAAAERAAGELLPAAAAAGAAPGVGVGSLGGPSAVEALRQRLASAAVEQPEGMAQTLRVWLHESRHEMQP